MSFVFAILPANMGHDAHKRADTSWTRCDPSVRCERSDDRCKGFPRSRRTEDRIAQFEVLSESRALLGPCHVPFQKAKCLGDFITAHILVRTTNNRIVQRRDGLAHQPLMGRFVSPVPKIGYPIYIVRGEHYKNISEIR